MSLKAALKTIVPAPVHQLRHFIHRRMQARKSPRDIFSDVYRKKRWDDYGATAEFFSGFGSHDKAIVDAYVAALEPILREIPNARVTDLGCGDFNVGRQIRHLCGPYIACDVVPELIERNKIEFAGADVDFRCLDIITDALPVGDIAIVRQVLQHLSNAQIALFLNQLNGYAVLVVTEHIPTGTFIPNLDKATGDSLRVHGLKPSGVDVCAAPFNLAHTSSKILSDTSDGNGIIRTTAYWL